MALSLAHSRDFTFSVEVFWIFHLDVFVSSRDYRYQTFFLLMDSCFPPCLFSLLLACQIAAHLHFPDQKATHTHKDTSMAANQTEQVIYIVSVCHQHDIQPKHAMVYLLTGAWPTQSESGHLITLDL